MSGPRNRAAFRAGQRRRELIRQLMLERAHRFPLAKPLTGEQIQHRLRAHGHYLAVSTVLWHVERIRLQADLEALTQIDSTGSNSSAMQAPLG